MFSSDMLFAFATLALVGNLLRLRPFNEAFQVRQLALPEDAVAAKPKVHRLQRMGMELEQPLPPDTVRSHQASLPEYPQVLRNGGP